MTNPLLDKISSIGYLKYPIGDIIPNWVYSSVRPLISKLNWSNYIPRLKDQTVVYQLHQLGYLFKRPNVAGAVQQTAF